MIWLGSFSWLPARPDDSGRSGGERSINMYIVYILQDKNGKTYKGMTNNISRRLSEHQRGKTKTTKNMKEIKIIFQEKHNTFEKARKREKYFKTAAGRRYLKTKLRLGSSVG